MALVPVARKMSELHVVILHKSTTDKGVMDITLL